MGLEIPGRRSRRPCKADVWYVRKNLEKKKSSGNLEIKQGVFKGERVTVVQFRKVEKYLLDLIMIYLVTWRKIISVTE